MDKVLSTKQAIIVAQKLHTENKKIVLVGGCFDLLHIGHITFLQKAKKRGDILFVLLEHDDIIKKIKGNNRPINTQQNRAKLLANLIMVDYVVLLPAIVDDTFYDNLTIQIKPAIIATTSGDNNIVHKKRQAKIVNAKVINVTMPIRDQSTTKLLTLLKTFSL